ncbi:MAG: hypothetical protein ACI83B_000968 [Sediminicola sp.]|jgi:hypothetical protein
MGNDTVVEEIKNKFVWKRKYTLVLLFNAVYIILFYLIMQRFI